MRWALDYGRRCSRSDAAAARALLCRVCGRPWSAPRASPLGAGLGSRRAAEVAAAARDTAVRGSTRAACHDPRRGRAAPRGAARRDPPARAPLLRRARSPRSPTRTTTAWSGSCATLEAAAPRARHRRTAPPSAWAGRRRRVPDLRPPRARCSASTTPTTRRSCGSSRSASSGWSGERELDYVAELKIDGLSMALHYESGRLARGVTRGDGVRGDDVTANVQGHQGGAPGAAGDDVPAELEVRGEVYLPRSRFDAINREREEAERGAVRQPAQRRRGDHEEPRPARSWPRAGSTSTSTRSRTSRERRRASQWEALERLRAWGLKTNPTSRALPRPRRGAGVLRGVAGEARHASSTRSTAWW